MNRGSKLSWVLGMVLVGAVSVSAGLCTAAAAEAPAQQAVSEAAQQPGNDLYQQGGRLALQGEYDKAYPYFEETLKVNPRHAGAYNGMAVISSIRGNQAKAEEYYSKAIEIDPT